MGYLLERSLVKFQSKSIHWMKKDRSQPLSRIEPQSFILQPVTTLTKLSSSIQQSPYWEDDMLSKSRNSPPFKEPEVSLIHSQQPANEPYLDYMNPGHIHTTNRYVYNVHFIFLSHLYPGRSRDNAVGRATGYGLEDRGGRSLSPRKVKNFLFSTSSRPALGSTQLLIQWVPGAPSPGIKRQGREADH
jgi:hypothetical protein